MDLANIMILSAMAFASANIDGMIIAIVFLTDRSYDGKNILLGQIIGFWVLTVASVIIAQSLYLMPGWATRWLGLVPIAFGCIKILNYARRDALELVAIRPNGRQIQEISLLTIATGADEIIAYAPLFATRKPQEMTIVFIIFGALTVVWWMMARWVAEQQIMRRLVSRGGPILVSLLMIAIGIIIISEN